MEACSPPEVFLGPRSGPIAPSLGENEEAPTGSEEVRPSRDRAVTEPWKARAPDMRSAASKTKGPSASRGQDTWRLEFRAAPIPPRDSIKILNPIRG